tara:strand:- start:137 stop:322 length:186 start_codon:yes stop_codon:yes gene_type:complete
MLSEEFFLISLPGTKRTNSGHIHLEENALLYLTLPTRAFGPRRIIDKADLQAGVNLMCQFD